MIEVAKKHLEQKRGYQVLAAVVSPTPDGMLLKKFWGKDGFLSDRGEAAITFLNFHCPSLQMFIIPYYSNHHIFTTIAYFGEHQTRARQVSFRSTTERA
jgi:hypothetical protein